jgi:hypothetical protein
MCPEWSTVKPLGAGDRARLLANCVCPARRTRDLTRMFGMRQCPVHLSTVAGILMADYFPASVAEYGDTSNCRCILTLNELTKSDD